MDAHGRTPLLPRPAVRLLRLPDVRVQVGLSRSMVYQLIAAGQFPAPIALTRTTRAWRSDEIAAWIDGLPRVINEGVQHVGVNVPCVDARRSTSGTEQAMA